MAVAIRTITRLQDADDVNVSLGAGVDEYTLSWDNDTAKFVLRAMSGGGVTDHGALTGLADDDHTQYLLATGARTGANSQAQAFTNGIIGPTWKPATDSTTALQLQNAAGTADILTVDTANSRVVLGSTTPIMAGTDRLLHRYGTNNLFAGTNAGNFTLSGIGGNTGLGAGVLLALTDGYYNVGIGHAALAGVTSGNNNIALGALTGSNLTTGFGNLALGYYALHAGTQTVYNVAIGEGAMLAYNPGSASGRNVAIGASALASLTSGVNNVAIGTAAGYAGNMSSSIYIGHNAGQNETGDSRLILDSQYRGGTEADQRIGAPVYAEMSTTLTSQLVRLNGVMQSLMTDGATSTVTTQSRISHNTSGTVANGFGSRVLWELESSTTADQTAAALDVSWNDATHETRKADLILTAYDSGGEREGLRIRGNGSAAAIGFLGATPAARIAHVADPSGGATVDAEARSAINSILATLETFGLHASS